MATAGWGAVGGGAWGPAPSSRGYEENDETPQQAAPAAGAFSATPAQPPDLATTSGRGQIPMTNTGGFGSSAGAYGLATAGGQASFNAAAGNSSMSEAALKRKEAELAAKEQQLKELEGKLASEGRLTRKNWPVCYPILYHNIVEEIPPQAQRIVREGYIAWWGLVFCLFWNWFAVCFMLGQDVKQKVPSWFLAVLYLVCGIPLSWWLWYRRLYNAGRKDSVLAYVWFFIWFSVHTGFCIWATIAVPFSVNAWSFAGFITAIKALDKCKFCGIIYLIGSGCWCALAAWSCWVIMDIFMFFRGKGGISQAKEEAKKEAALAAVRQGALNQA